MITEREMGFIEILYDSYREKFGRNSVCCHKEMYAIIHEPMNYAGSVLDLMLSRVGQPAPRVDKSKFPKFEELPTI